MKAWRAIKQIRKGTQWESFEGAVERSQRKPDAVEIALAAEVKIWTDEIESKSSGPIGELLIDGKG